MPKTRPLRVKGKGRRRTARIRKGTANRVIIFSPSRLF